ncbi:hypothetical protein V1J52_06045 [Streptomyces sp. TRM 70351]|uniref:hypothetical protein n=1 Tax=Streptomyces sp. TRM 70351 TaxID=3116552 RepID=UPI002E7BB517|nr:hypothetical protein [Streptomyces sp. TRM 70351]MEE1927755.1 hypothetical protein [Streptomyces sp. TRM 70351]
MTTNPEPGPDGASGEHSPGALLPLGGADEDAWLAEAAAARAFRAAAETVPGVRAGDCRVVPLDATAPAHRPALPGSRLPRGPVRVRIGVTAPLDLTSPVPKTAEAVRQRVLAAATGQLGLDVGAVDVSVDDLHTVPGDEAEGR